MECICDSIPRTSGDMLAQSIDVFAFLPRPSCADKGVSVVTFLSLDSLPSQ